MCEKIKIDALFSKQLRVEFMYNYHKWNVNDFQTRSLFGNSWEQCLLAMSSNFLPKQFYWRAKNEIKFQKKTSFWWMLNVSFDAWMWLKCWHGLGKFMFREMEAATFSQNKRKTKWKLVFFSLSSWNCYFTSKWNINKKNRMKNNNKKLLKDIQNCSNNDGKYGNI